MLLPTEAAKLRDALAAAKATLDKIEAAYRNWRNTLSIFGLYEDAETKRARERFEAAQREYLSIRDGRDWLAVSRDYDHEAVMALGERALRLAASDAAAVIEREGRGSNVGAILGGVARDVGDNVGQVGAGVADAAKTAVGKTLGALPWWAWAAGGVALLVVFAPTINAVVQARAQR